MSDNKKVTNECLPVPVSKSIIDLMLARNEILAAHKLEQEKLHDELWAAIHAEFPSLDTNANYSIDSEYIEAGVAMLKNRKPCNHSDDMPDGLKKILARVLTEKAIEELADKGDKREH